MNLCFRYHEAEQQLNICLQIYKLCLPPNSFHYLVSKASLGLIYKQQGHYKQALPLFQSIAESLGNEEAFTVPIENMYSGEFRYQDSIIPMDQHVPGESDWVLLTPGKWNRGRRERSFALSTSKRCSWQSACRTTRMAPHQCQTSRFDQFNSTRTFAFTPSISARFNEISGNHWSHPCFDAYATASKEPCPSPNSKHQQSATSLTQRDFLLSKRLEH